MKTKLIVSPITIGEKIRNRRLEQNLTQSQAAQLIDVSTDTITLWELNRYKPQINQLPAIIRFLGYNPLQEQREQSIGESLLAYRTQQGMTRKALAQVIGVDVQTITKCETNLYSLAGKGREKIMEYLRRARQK